MTNIDHAAKTIDAWTQDGHELNSHVGNPSDLARALADAGLLAPEPQIIRTREELAALDPDTVLMTTDLFDPLTPVWDWLDGEGNPARGSENGLPAVVLATGEQVRAARQALEDTDATD